MQAAIPFSLAHKYRLQMRIPYIKLQEAIAHIHALHEALHETTQVLSG